MQMLSPLLEQIAVGASGETVGMVIRNASPTGAASLLLDSNNQNGVAELVVLSGGSVQINSFQQFISFNNLRAGQHGHRAEHRGQQRRGGHLRLRLRQSERPGTEGERPGHSGGGTARDLRRGGAAALRPHRRRQGADRLRGPGRAASGKLGATMCKTKNLEGRELMALDYQKLSLVRGEEAAEACGGPGGTKENGGGGGHRAVPAAGPDFNVRDLGSSIRSLEVPGAGGPRERALAALRSDVARQILASKPRSLGKSAAEEPNDRLQADLIDFSSDWWSRTCSPGRQGPRRSCLQAGGDGDPDGGEDHP